MTMCILDPTYFDALSTIASDARDKTIRRH
jgi:hypothetical protein